jgi:TonB family protein
MTSFAAKRLVTLASISILHILCQQPAFAYPIGHPRSQSSDSARMWAGFEIRTPTQGVDFGPFTKSLFQSVIRKWIAGAPPSVEKGEQGTVFVQFRVLQDGEVPADSLKVVRGSGKKELDDASLNAVHNVAPFDHLPSKFSQPFIEVRIIFNYNVARPKMP